ncbi:MAG: hypothetical protein HZA93_27970 [Verrucomicrobia bacterium]|nr:hypothetical protein [Verrucomicrobiota bacterium]
MKRTSLFALLLLVLGGCAFGLRPIDTRDFSSCRRVLMLYDGGAVSTNYLFVIADHHVGFDVYRPKPVKPGETHYVIARQRWTKLDAQTASLVWKRIEELRILDWKDQYSPKDLNMQISDGTQWWVTFRDGKAEKKSGGNNVYPKLSPIGDPTLQTELLTGQPVPNAYHRLLRLLRESAEKD